MLVTGSGAVRFTGPLAAVGVEQKSIAPTTSSRWIQGKYWRPPATGPPRPSLKNGSILPSAPPSDSTTPVRVRTTRMPSSAAARASASHATTTRAAKSSPAGADSSSRSSPRAP